MNRQELDKKCNELFKKLEAMKAAKQDRNDNAEYMQTLYSLRDYTRQRTQSLSKRTL